MNFLSDHLNNVNEKKKRWKKLLTNQSIQYYVANLKMILCSLSLELNNIRALVNFVRRINLELKILLENMGKYFLFGLMLAPY